ncbi:30S ribosomal protein S20 [Balneola sp. MJW-20]|uniref:30S ribosomal protein S20 n=1 Tax=Gracilimonas aurantiaca TaxID=3234185 RepID=UPI003467B3E0
MPQTKQAIKRVRQAQKRKEHNKTRRSRIRTLVKKVYEAKDKAAAEKALTDAVSFIDRMTTKGIIHKNTAGRKKAQITKYVNNL